MRLQEGNLSAQGTVLLCGISLLHLMRVLELLQVLYPDTVASLLSLVHQHLADARHARHGLQALGPLRALLQLLGPHMCEPATFRYAVHIVLQAMDKQ